MLIKNALVSTPKGVVNQDVLIDEGKIVAISEHLDASNH